MVTKLLKVGTLINQGVDLLGEATDVGNFIPETKTGHIFKEKHQNLLKDASGDSLEDDLDVSDVGEDTPTDSEQKINSNCNLKRKISISNNITQQLTTMKDPEGAMDHEETKVAYLT